jgi:hypothetical protein
MTNLASILLFLILIQQLNHLFLLPKNFNLSNITKKFTGLQYKNRPKNGQMAVNNHVKYVTLHLTLRHDFTSL